jgi:hypothetical protein
LEDIQNQNKKLELQKDEAEEQFIKITTKIKNEKLTLEEMCEIRE